MRARLAASAAALIVLMAAASELWRIASYAPIERLSARVEDATRVSAPDFEPIEARLDTLSGSQDCRLRELEASIRLRLLTMMPAGAEPLREDAHLDAASAALERVIACAPADGYAWLRVGIVEAVRSGGGALMEVAFRNSSLTAPFESHVLVPRLQHGQRLRAGGQDGLADIVAADVRTAVLHLRDRDLASLYREAASSMRALYRDTLSFVSEPRRARLTQLFERIESEVPRG